LVGWLIGSPGCHVSDIDNYLQVIKMG